MSSILTDRHGRFHDYLRISLTDACNLRCQYCMPEEDMRFMKRSHLMSVEELDSLAGLFVRHGVKKIRLTGGEPLVRKEAAEIISRLGRYPIELAMTTNGVLVDQFLDVFQQAGLRSINVSLDSLDPVVNRSITQRDYLDKVIRNIEMLAHDDYRVKVNMVVMKGVNEFEVGDFVAWSKDLPLHIRFIEYMPFDGNGWSSAQVTTHQQILEMLRDRFTFHKLTDGPNDTARAYQVEGFAGTFAVISTMSQPFCETCNRIRLTADGKLKNCLFSAGETDLLSALRGGQDVEPLIRQTIQAKHARLGGQLSENYLDTDPDQLKNRAMISIGG